MTSASAGQPSAGVRTLGPSAPAVPRVFQVGLVAYVLLTGELVRGLQAVFFGLQGGGDGFFTLATLLAIMVDLIRVAPVIYFARHPLGILHPLVLTTVLWPLLIAMPRTIGELGGLGGLLLGEQVSPPFYTGLGWLPGPEIWQAEAWAHLFEIVALLSIYAGYALFQRPSHRPIRAVPRGSGFDSRRLRTVAMVLIGLSIAVLLTLIAMRGGLSQHLGDMARGRFRSMAGLGPLVALVDLGLVALVVWIAARPQDSRTPVLLSLMVGISIAQFLSNGARSAAFAVFLLVGVTWALKMRRIPWRLAAILVPLFFLSFGALNIVRTAGFTGKTIEQSGTADALVSAQEEIDLRISLQSTVPVIWAGHELMGGPLMGSTYAAAIFAMVPRTFWEAKPRGPGSIYAQSFLGEVREGLAIPVSATAEEYWNFGLLGVILISALYGVLIRLAHSFFVSNQENPFAVGFFVIFVTTFTPSTDALVLFQQQIGMLFIMLVLAYPFAHRRLRAAPGQLKSPQPDLWSEHYSQR